MDLNDDPCRKSPGIRIVCCCWDGREVGARLAASGAIILINELRTCVWTLRISFV